MNKPRMNTRMNTLQAAPSLFTEQVAELVAIGAATPETKAAAASCCTDNPAPAQGQCP